MNLKILLLLILVLVISPVMAQEYFYDTIKIASAVLEEFGKTYILAVGNDIIIKTQKGISVFENPLEEKINLQQYSTDLIFTQEEDQSWSGNSVVELSSRHVVFVVRRQDHYPHFFVAYHDSDHWKLICMDQGQKCSIFGMSPFCMIADRDNSRLLIQYNGLAYDEALDKYFKKIAIIQYHSLQGKQIGELNLSSSIDGECGPENYKQWYLKYLKIAKQTSFIGYLD